MNRERRGETECRRSTDPSHQHAAERRSAGKGNGARQFDPRIGRGQQLRRYQRRHQRRRRDAVDDRAAYRDEARQREQGQCQQVEADQHEDCEQRRGAQGFRARHQPPPRDAVGEQACGDREQDERQRQRGLQQAGLAFADAEQQHRDDRSRGQRDLLGRLRREIGPGQAVEGRRQAEAVVGRGHDWISLHLSVCRHCLALGACQATRFPTASTDGLDAVANELQ